LKEGEADAVVMPPMIPQDVVGGKVDNITQSVKLSGAKNGYN